MQLGKIYNHKEYEADIYNLWEKANAFAPTGVGEPFAMVMPPPNANATLHIGHALMFSIEDVIVRYQRMQGRDVLWLPGADHAGFETQVVYEKHLAREGKSRFDFSREELYGQIMDFVAGNRDNFNDIFRKLGASCDWTRFTFTLDDRVIDTAYSTFKKLWDDNLIYRGERLVNYCTYHQTGFADIEVVYEERQAPLYYMKYGPFTLATTRPETKFGDTAVAVNPNDDRYKQYIGQTIEVEGLNGWFKLQVVADDYVDPEFGTGVVKITPAHDFNDWEVARRHNLPAVRVINYDGTLNENAGEFAGLNVTEGREAVVKALKKKGLLEKVDKDYQNRVGTCYKCGTTIEPMLLEQWFIDMKQLAEPAIKALKSGRIKFYPEAKCSETVRYLENVRDWNISRQIAWGIPIPAFQNVADPNDWVFDTVVSEEIIERNGKKYRRDPDVFDTWFSSGQWPFVTMGYPDNDDFKRYYPNALMETGTDILYQWVARMICLGIYVTGEIPFREVYLHGMVRAEDGRKMSKSLGNVIDPQEILDSHGSDALRMGMIAGRSAGDNAAFAPAKVTAGRNFCNKLWNIARYTEATLKKADVSPEAKAKTAADEWLLHRLNQAIETVSGYLDNYRFAEAYEATYHFVWDDFADWYIEASKHALNGELLAYGLESVLKLSHPFAPFTTETIWQTLGWRENSLLINQPWPATKHADTKKALEFEEIRTIVTETRAIIAALKLRKTKLFFTEVPFLRDNAELIAGLARISGVHEVEDGKGLHLTTTRYNCWLDVDRETTEHYVSKLQKQLEEADNLRKNYKARLANEAYVKRAPKELVAQTRQQLTDTDLLIRNIQQEIERFSKAD